ncbi:MAG: SpoIIE family protein phosphatase [Solirubrobacteraceae bacterium]
MLAYSDGLIERRGESLDVGMERLRAAAGRERAPLEERVERVARELASDDNDDMAILGVRWQD